jgi:hypothetical protein
MADLRGMRAVKGRGIVLKTHKDVSMLITK